MSGEPCPGVLVVHVPVDPRQPVVLEVLPSGAIMSAAQVQEAAVEAPAALCATGGCQVM